MTADAGRWVRAASTADVLEDEPLGVEIEGVPIALYRCEGAYYATSNVCTHAYALLSDGFVEGCEVECPLHSGRFDVRTGKALTSPVDTDLQTYPVRVSGDDLDVLVPE